MRVLIIPMVLVLGACAADSARPAKTYCLGRGGVYTGAGGCYGDDPPLDPAELPVCVPSKSGNDLYRAPCRPPEGPVEEAAEPSPEAVAVAPAESPAPPAESREDEAVRAAQILLAALDLDPGEATGTLVPRTENAIRNFQKRLGLPEDGQVSAGLLRLLRQAVTTRPPPPELVSKPGTAATPERIRTGSGFVVSRDGHVLTSRHVIEGCATLEAGPAQKHGPAELVTADRMNDLALLRIAGWEGAAAQFRDGMDIRAGDEVVVLGYPLSDILAPEAHVTTGTVSALAGLRNDIRHLQISAPVQPGNSGGPVFDRQGRLIAVVASKLDSVKMAGSASQPLQNVNFAIRGSLARALLDANGVDYGLAENATDMTTADIGELARPITVRIECWR